MLSRRASRLRCSSPIGLTYQRSHCHSPRAWIALHRGPLCAGQHERFRPSFGGCRGRRL